MIRSFLELGLCIFYLQNFMNTGAGKVKS